jgi:hypothetical protein
MQWNDHGAALGYDYQKPETTGITIRSVPQQPTPEPLSKADANRVKDAVKEIERREKK